jgi:hypothetical protein
MKSVGTFPMGNAYTLPEYTLTFMFSVGPGLSPNSLLRFTFVEKIFTAILCSVLNDHVKCVVKRGLSLNIYSCSACQHIGLHFTV